jgi:hypothetical protein
MFGNKRSSGAIATVTTSDPDSLLDSKLGTSNVFVSCANSVVGTDAEADTRLAAVKHAIANQCNLITRNSSSRKKIRTAVN